MAKGKLIFGASGVLLLHSNCLNTELTMNPAFLQLLKKAGNYAPAQQQLLEQALAYRSLQKGEVLLEQGQVCSAFCFIIEGAVYQYLLDSDLSEQVIDLNIANDWVVNHKSFTSRKPSEYTIKAIEKTELFCLSIESVHELIAQSQAFLQMGTILEEATARVRLFDNNYSPDEKYQYILKNKPELIQKFPQRLIASYLKMTPETLSRVRARIS